MSETDKHRAIAERFCQGNGVDLGSGGSPVVPWAIQVEFPDERYRWYNPDRPETAIQWRGDACDLPFKDGTLDFVHSSHLIEDYFDWAPVLAEWDRVLKPGGFLLIAVPDHERFRAAVRAGQGDNLNHKHESFVGELTKACSEPFMSNGYEAVRDGFVGPGEYEYSILYVGRKRYPGEPRG